MNDDEARPGPVIVPAKLRTPAPRTEAVPRDRLVEILGQAGPEQLRAVIAPTGWGKSELVAQWLAHHDGPVAYLRLDRHDNDPARCWTHLLTAIGDATDLETGDLTAILRAPGLPLLREVVEPLLGRLEGHAVTLVLEDLASVTSTEVTESVEALIDGRPPTMGVAVISRFEPALHLPRRRAHGELVEIRLDDLRLDADAARTVVSGASGWVMPDDVIEPLLTRTEGWAAGLYLVGLSLRTARDPAEFVARFSGTDRNISEYLASEVLDGLPDEDREFLVDTSVLSVLEPELCDAVTGRTDSAGRLDSLARRNLFLIPTDDQASSYRHHRLFGQWLGVELDRAGAEHRRLVHRRAAEALAARSDHANAADHAIEAGDAELAYRSVVRASLDLLDTGRHASAEQLCRRLPPPPDGDRALDIALLRGWARIVDGDLDGVARACGEAATAAAGELSDRRRARVGEIALLRAYAALLRGAATDCAEALDEAALLGISRRAEATRAFIDAAAAFWWSPSDADPGERLTAARASAVEIDDPYAALLCESYLALHAIDDGRGPDADAHIGRSLEIADEHHLAGFGYLAASRWALARRLAASGDLDEAATAAEVAIDLAERRDDRLVAIGARVTAGEIEHSRGDVGAARDHLATARRDLDPLPGSARLDDVLATAERQLRLQQSPSRRSEFPAPVEPLTDRELALLRLLPGDMTQRELGDALHMSFNTVKTYNRQIYRKLGVSSRDDAVAAARAAGLL